MKTKINLLNLLVVVSLVLALVGLPVNVQAAATSVAPDSQETPTGLGTPIVTYAVKQDVSPALRDIEQSASPTGTYREMPLQSLYKGDKTGALAVSDKDLAVQDWNGVSAMPAPLANFDGIYNTYSVAPPDTQGDIGYDPATGKKYYVQWVNLGYAVWDVTDVTSPTQVLAPRNGNTLWTGFGGQCETNNDGDPITLYDPLSNRWLMTQFAVNNPYYQCIAVSTSADPTGTYYRYAFEWKNGAGTPTMNDYPKFGVWPDGYYATANQFIGNSWAGTGVAAFERSQMLNGGPARMVYFDLGVSDWGGMLPVRLRWADATASQLSQLFCGSACRRVGEHAGRLLRMKRRFTPSMWIGPLPRVRLLRRSVLCRWRPSTAICARGRRRAVIAFRSLAPRNWMPLPIGPCTAWLIATSAGTKHWSAI